jgi:hypothetical protein
MSPSLAARLAADPEASLDGTLVFMADSNHGDQQLHDEMEDLILRHYESGSLLGDVAADDMLVEAGRHCRAFYWRNWNPLGGACNLADDETIKDRIFDKHGPPFEQAAAEALRLHGLPVPDGFWERYNAVFPLIQEARHKPMAREKRDACMAAWDAYKRFKEDVRKTMAERDRHMLNSIRAVAFGPDGKRIDNKVIWFTVGTGHWDTMQSELMAMGDVLYVEKKV